MKKLRLGCLDQTPSRQQILNLACECVWWYPDLDLLHSGNGCLVALWIELGHYSSCVRNSGCGSMKKCSPSNPLKDLLFKTLGTVVSLKICFLFHIIIDDELSVISHSFYPSFSTEALYPLNTVHFPSPAPVNHHSTFCLYEFDYLRYLI